MQNGIGTAKSVRLAVEGVSKIFTASHGPVEALRKTDMRVGAGEFVVLVGSSGCGKTTLLNMIAGFEAPTTGAITMDGEAVSGPSPRRMMMFQEHALFPWLTAVENVMFGLGYQNRRLSLRKQRERALHYLEMVQLGRFANANIHELSGGMRQRVSLARALAPEPEIILFDEPFGALDALSRERFYAHIQGIFARTGKTAVFVTHNVREAACLADRVLVFSSRPGRVRAEIPVPLPRPRDFYDPEVARLAGRILEELRADSGGAEREETA